MFVRFQFENTPEGIAKFFKEELPSLIEACSFLVFTGHKIDYIDLENQRIVLKGISMSDLDLKENPEVTEIQENNINDTLESSCKSCRYFSPKSEFIGTCTKHGYSTRATEYCIDFNRCK